MAQQQEPIQERKSKVNNYHGFSMFMNTTTNNDKQEQLKLDALNKIFGWIEDKETKAVMINKYYNNKEHRAALKAFLDNMVKALDESTAETNSKEEIKRQLSYIT